MTEFWFLPLTKPTRPHRYNLKVIITKSVDIDLLKLLTEKKGWRREQGRVAHPSAAGFSSDAKLVQARAVTPALSSAAAAGHRPWLRM
eukprot:scaffold330512_cov36-Prasinocladus_malaysianus.AAC.1